MSTANPGDLELRRKLLWLMGLRAATVTALLGSAILIKIKAPGEGQIDPFFVVIAATYALTAVYALTLKYFERYRLLVDAQLATDALTVSLIVLFTGGVTSYFSSLYALPIIAASMLQFRRGGLTVAVFSSLVYAGLVLVQYETIFGFVTGNDTVVSLPAIRVAVYSVGLNTFGFLGIGVLSGSLAEGLRRADAQLELASTEIADLQAFNQYVIDSLTSGLATTDNNARLLTFNRSAEIITGLAAGSVRGRRVADVLQLAPEVEATLLDDLRGARGRRVDVMHVRPDGRQIEIGLSAVPLMTSGTRAGFIFTFQDVTEIRKLERDARIQQRLAAVGEMAAGIAHEIRNPLASMSGSVQVLRDELPLTNEQAQLMDIVLRESERLNDTINNFLAFARPQRLSASCLDVRDLARDTAILLRNSPECQAGHAIDVVIPPTPVLFEADEGQIRQILWNLATNGLRAMPNGGRLRISVELEAVPDSAVQDSAETIGDVIFSVEDEGIGIPPEDLDVIFQPFRGAFERGTGLGLAIVHRIVSDYNGEIRVTSRPGSGTQVRIQFRGGRMPSQVVAGHA